MVPTSHRQTPHRLAPVLRTRLRSRPGLQHDIYQQPLISRQPCPCGQPGQEIDHHVALSVAHATGSTRTILRAYMLDNLTFLCKNCHAAKSGLDRRTVNNLRQGRPADFRRHDTKTPPKDQMSLF